MILSPGMFLPNLNQSLANDSSIGLSTQQIAEVQESPDLQIC